MSSIIEDITDRTTSRGRWICDCGGTVQGVTWTKAGSRRSYSC